MGSPQCLADLGGGANAGPGGGHKGTVRKERACRGVSVREQRQHRENSVTLAPGKRGCYAGAACDETLPKEGSSTYLQSWKETAAQITTDGDTLL